MNKIDIAILKSLILDYGQYIVILVLSFFIFRSCQGGNELKLANDGLQQEVKVLAASADKYVSKNNALNDKITLLETQKQKVKKEIVYIQNKAKSDIEKVTSLNSSQIVKYYRERYKLPIVITQYGVSLSDTIAKKNIVELIEKDGCFEEIKLVRTELQIEEQKGVLKDSVNGNLVNANIMLKEAVTDQNKIIDNVEKSLRKEKNKKTFWQVTTMAVVGIGTYLLIVK